MPANGLVFFIERLRNGSPIRERALDWNLRIRISEVNQLETGSGLPSPACSPFGFLLDVLWYMTRPCQLCFTSTSVGLNLINLNSSISFSSSKKTSLPASSMRHSYTGPATSPFRSPIVVTTKSSFSGNDILSNPVSDIDSNFAPRIISSVQRGELESEQPLAQRRRIDIAVIHFISQANR